MRHIRLLKAADYHAAATLIANAYPGLNLVTAEERQQLAARIETTELYPPLNFYGLFEESGSGTEEMLGVMRYHDYQMKLLSTSTLVGGIGGIAVDLSRRKEKIAREIMLHFLRHYRQRNACLAVLYPFRPDFYRQMGFDHGPKMNQYRLQPDKMPRGTSKANVTLLQDSDKNAVNECYRRFRERSNGLFERDEYAAANLYDSAQTQAVGFKQDGQIWGYFLFKFRPLETGHVLRHEMVITELVYETPEVLWQLLTFLHSLADQVEQIELHTQDEYFHHLFADPRNDSGLLLFPVWHQNNVQGVGLMYRIIDTRRLFEVLAEHPFGRQTCQLKITVEDDFLPENAGSTFVAFRDGRAQLYSGTAYDVEITLDVSDLSSMIIGAVPLERLVAYGLAQISDTSFMPALNQLFHVAHKPLCFTSF